MLYWAAVFCVIALIAAVFGFGGLAASAAGVAKILFFVFLVFALISFLFGRRSPAKVRSQYCPRVAIGHSMRRARDGGSRRARQLDSASRRVRHGSAELRWLDGLGHVRLKTGGQCLGHVLA